MAALAIAAPPRKPKIIHAIFTIASSLPVKRGDRPPTATLPYIIFEQSYRYPAKSFLLSVSLSSVVFLTNHTFSFCKVTKLFLPDNGKQRFYLTLQELILFSQQFILSSQGSITTKRLGDIRTVRTIDI